MHDSELAVFERRQEAGELRHLFGEYIEHPLYFSLPLVGIPWLLFVIHNSLVAPDCIRVT